jgi:DNA-binding winged helix-turn-helix (wHTH) protein
VLRSLVERPGEVVTRQDLRARLWAADTFVEFDDGLNHAVKKLRQALGDSAEAPEFIETLPRHGYRFVAPMLIGSAFLLIKERDSGNTGSQNQTKTPSGDTMPARIVHPASGKAHSERTPGWR